jgi:hypothetical protein
MDPPNGPSYNWTTDIAAGTTMVFIMIDSRGRQGGSSDILTVASSDDSTCLNAHSPTSTASPSASGTSAPVVTETASSQASVGAIAGTALGALIALVCIYFYLSVFSGISCVNFFRLSWLLSDYFSSRNGKMIDVQCMLATLAQVATVHSPLGLQRTY